MKQVKDSDHLFIPSKKWPLGAGFTQWDENGNAVAFYSQFFHRIAPVIKAAKPKKKKKARKSP